LIKVCLATMPVLWSNVKEDVHFGGAEFFGYADFDLSGNHTKSLKKRLDYYAKYGEVG